MTANDNKFYWIKLKTNFFSREDIDFLLSQPNGAEYVVLYQMLCLNTANNEGRLESSIGEIIVPYDAEKIVRDCKHFDIDTVNIAIALYKKLELIYEENDGILKISDYEDMVGSAKNDEHTRLLNAERQRKYRNKQKQLSSVTVTHDVTDDVTLFRNVEIRDKRLDIYNNIYNNHQTLRNVCSVSDSPSNDIKNTSNSFKILSYEDEFERLWNLYPKKQGKKDALRHYINARKKGTTFEQVEKGIDNYNNYINASNISSRYIKQGSTWFNQECWNDEYDLKNPNLPNWVDKKIEEKELTQEEEQELNGILDEFRKE